MKNMILHTMGGAILFSLISGIVVVFTGLMLGWKTSTQFSDGFFWAGAIFISIGCVNILGMFYHSGQESRQSAVHFEAPERFKIWEADVLHGYNLLAFLMISGLLLYRNLAVLPPYTWQ